MPDFSFESALHSRGMRIVAGVDEAGRGPLAGPVCAAAVVLPVGYLCPGLDDSKKLTARKREDLFLRLTGDERIRWAISFAEVDEIDRVNILRATHAAMARAVAALQISVDHCLIDGLPLRSFAWSHDGIVKGDSKSMSIAAASVIAKVSRDRKMLELADKYPEYGFQRHMGYGTREHLEALRRHGPCRIHRRSFQPVAQLALPIDA